MQIAKFSECVTITSREIAEICGKRHDNVMVDCRKLSDFYAEKYSPEKSGQSIKSSTYIDSTGRVLPCMELDKDACVDLITGYSLEHRHAVNQRWKELEATQSQPFKVPQTLREALLLAAELEGQKAAALALADEATRTKAEIGSRREATAMATASSATRKANELERQLDKAKDYATVKRMTMLHHGIKFDWRKLRDASVAMEVPAIDVFDQNYGTVKAYHKSLWIEAYAVGIHE